MYVLFEAIMSVELWHPQFNHASMYMWNESAVSKGAGEICSCLKHYFSLLTPETKRLTIALVRTK